MQKKACLFLFLLLAYILVPHAARLQNVTLASKTSPSVEFTFNTISKYVNGITIPNALTLNVDADLTQWDLYVGATTVTPGEWDITTQYSTNGSDPTVDLMEIRLRNFNNTSLITGFFPLTDIASPTYIIGSATADSAHNCSDIPPTGTNTPGDYITSPECYKFSVDLRVVPGLTHRAGLYTLRIDFMLVQDL